MNEITVRDRSELSIEDMVAQVEKIQKLMQSVMKEGEHFGVIPGTEKPTLLQPGAQKICFTFRLGEGKPEVRRDDLPGNHREYTIVLPILHVPTGNVLSYGVGSCSTMEVKYRYRNAGRVCPICGKEAIIKGKQEYGGGWLCYKKKNGCGAKFADEAPEITSQIVGRIENLDLADSYNTVLKMATKRAYVNGVIKATAASDLFTQDIEDTAAAESRGPVAEEGEPTYNADGWRTGITTGIDRLIKKGWINEDEHAGMLLDMENAGDNVEALQKVYHHIKKVWDDNKILAVNAPGSQDGKSEAKPVEV